MSFPLSWGTLKLLTVTTAVDLCVPPGPIAIRVYVVVLSGATDLEPCAWTLPTSGSKSRLVAFREDQCNLTDWPLSTVAGSAVSVAFGATGGGGGGWLCDSCVVTVTAAVAAGLP